MRFVVEVVNLHLLLLTASIGLAANDGGEVARVSGLLGGMGRLPCDTTPPSHLNPLLLVVWLKEPGPNPIYSYDVRKSDKAQHWYDTLNLGGRAFFTGHNESAYLSLENLQESDRGKYRCRVDFKQAPSKINKVMLEVIVQPSVPKLLSPEGLNFAEKRYFEGSHLRVNCSVRGGRPRPIIHWRVNGQTVVGEEVATSYSDTVVSSLDFGTVTRKDLYSNITCLATNNNISRPQATNGFIDLKLMPLLVEIQSNRNAVSANKTATVQCISWGSRPPAVITWWLGGELLPANWSKMSPSGERTNSSESVLQFVPTKADIGKFVKCRAENPDVPASQIEDSWNLDVDYPPEVSLALGQTLDGARIKDGDDVYFECSLTAKPAVHRINWLFNGEELRQNVREGVIMGNQSLVLQSVSKHSSGNYVCAATNTEGETHSQPINLDVKYKPTCRGDEKRVFGVARGEVISINCTVDGNPSNDIEFRWSFNNTSETTVLKESRYTVEGDVSRLIYSPFHELDYGTIRCWARNSLGEQGDPCMFHIIPAGPPEPPHSCSLNGSSERLEANCQMGFDGGLEQTFQIELFLQDNGELILNQSSQNARFVLGRVESKKTYSILIYSHNSKGRSEVVRMHEVNPDYLTENGPITRAAKNTDAKSEDSQDRLWKYVSMEDQLGEMGGHSADQDRAQVAGGGVGGIGSGGGIGGQDGNPLLSIVLGVASALVVVVLVILVTMTVRCGRTSSSSAGSYSGGSAGSSTPLRTTAGGSFDESWRGSEKGLVSAANGRSGSVVSRTASPDPLVTIDSGSLCEYPPESHHYLPLASLTTSTSPPMTSLTTASVVGLSCSDRQQGNRFYQGSLTLPRRSRCHPQQQPHPAEQTGDGSDESRRPEDASGGGLLSLKSLPPPPPPPMTSQTGINMMEELPCTELPPPPEWATSSSNMAANAGRIEADNSFFTLPRGATSNPAQLPGANSRSQRTVRFQQQVQSRSINSLDRIRKSTSHIESIV